MKPESKRPAIPPARMKTEVKLLFTSISAVLIAIGLMAIVTETHTGYGRYVGVRTLIGNDAIWMGQTCLILGVLPLLVWLPQRWIGLCATAWGIALLTWIFVPLFVR